MTAIKIQKLYPKDFPPQLNEIPGPPKILYLRGTLPPDGTVLLSVVGSRAHTPYGKSACEEIIAGLAGAPLAIVSGLALGIDGIAHRAALKAGLTTVAVPGSGLSTEVLYPFAHHGLAEKIIADGGALLSEFEPDFRATPWSFPQRNRIMAGLSKATLVIEAGERSGTLITARLALDYNRDVLAVPGSIFSESSRGVHRLLRQGATPVTSSADVLDALDLLPATEHCAVQRDVTDDEAAVLLLISEPLQRDELIRKMDMPTAAAQTILTAMELKGIITESLGLIRLT
ncbi:MAG: DNA-protecting protein DprA [Candidatus Lloydbacteria bacterium CG22_combo_CG10-13_8_21_14_all_47_15]|uniref:DNA-protecting protein DprA n=1 Tax=Candidatus Lloydbacteria bacterium CG22_combo_CG10-13_8_21_14_all_47_15 TaxID=1974635 RepID=A0A2H0CV13_9BACT|nr:MAG: DNA-protecting protein DprA [Candidatus Lloydbacteria bacterium CG22_combo_CG10-13_8_21_14_all_47_15]